MVLEVGRGLLQSREVYRFSCFTSYDAAHLVLDTTRLLADVETGLRLAAGEGPVDGIGVDTWGADFALLGEDGALLGPVVSYRDGRTEGIEPDVWGGIGQQNLYRRTGAAHQRYNTIFQLAAEQRGLSPLPGRLERAAHLLMMPDFVAYHLTGVVTAEVTAASTTGLIDPATRDWAWDVIEALGLPRRLFGPVVQPGAIVGHLLADVAGRVGLPESVPVIAVGGHDTASAVAAVPAIGADFAYVSCGTWSLVGAELAGPCLTEAAWRANFTNELGADGTVRFLRNVSGLWLLNECQRAWRTEGLTVDTAGLLEQAALLPPGPPFDADDQAFIAPGNMPARVAAAAADVGRDVSGPAELTRAIIDSLADAYARAIADAARLTGQAVNRVHLVGGGSRGQLLCQAAADATGLEVQAGPAEATALGNALIQARTVGALSGSLDSLRALVATSKTPISYLPQLPF
jgi:rhamnulokinase